MYGRQGEETIHYSHSHIVPLFTLYYNCILYTFIVKIFSIMVTVATKNIIQHKQLLYHVLEKDKHSQLLPL